MNPIVALLCLFGLLAIFSLCAQWRIPERREVLKGKMQRVLASCGWYVLPVWWYVAGGVLNIFERRRLSPANSPQLYLDTRWRCVTIEQYLRLIAAKPAYAETTAERLVRMIRRAGIDWRRTLEARFYYRDRQLLCYNAFAGSPERRKLVKRRLEAIVASCGWCAMRALCHVAGSFLNVIDQVRCSPEFSPELYLDESLRRMSLAEYLELVAKNPVYAETTSQRLARVIKRHGIDWIRTLEARFRYRHPYLVCYNAFAGLVLIDPRVLDKLVRQLALDLSCQRGPIMLIGAPTCGMTGLLQRLGELLLEAEPVATISGAVVQTGALRLISVLPTIAAKPRGIDHAMLMRLLAEVGVERLIDIDNERFRTVCLRQQLPPSVLSLPYLAEDSRETFMEAVLAGIGVPDSSIRALRVLSTFEINALSEQDLLGPIIEFQRIAEEHVRTIAPYARHSVNRAHLLGEVKSGMPGVAKAGERDYYSLNGEFSRTSMGMLSVEDICRYSAEALQLFIEAPAFHGVPLPDNQDRLGWEGLLVVVSTDLDYAQFVGEPNADRFLPHCNLLSVDRAMDVQGCEQLLRGFVRDWRDVDPLAIAYAARFFLLSNSDLDLSDVAGLATFDPFCNRQAWRLPKSAARCLDMKIPVSVRQLERALVKAALCSQGETVTLDDVRDALKQAMADHWHSHPAKRAQALLSDVLDAWAKEPHPLCELRRIFAELCRQLRKHDELAHQD